MTFSLKGKGFLVKYAKILEELLGGVPAGNPVAKVLRSTVRFDVPRATASPRSPHTNINNMDLPLSVTGQTPLPVSTIVVAPRDTTQVLSLHPCIYGLCLMILRLVTQPAHDSNPALLRELNVGT